MKPLNQTVLATPQSGIRRFFDIAQQMEDVVSLGVGEPDFVTPWRIREAVIYALENSRMTYTANAGMIDLRQAVCAHTFGRYGVHYSPETECLITVGVSEAIDLALRTILNPGDEVLYVEPCYVSYHPGIGFAGGVPVAIPSRGDEGFSVRPEDIRTAITRKTKAILLCYPGNPTGATLSRENLQQIVDIAVEHDLYILSDEIYDRLVYNGEHVCVPSLRGAQERTILFNGFSKTYSMTGWRVGYALGPADVIAGMLKIHQYSMLSASSIGQVAAIEALRHGEADVREMIEEYNQRRRYFVNGLREAGLECPEPSGAFYAFPSIRNTGLTSEEFAEGLLMSEKVAVIPGNAFGPSGEGHVRCSYATNFEQLEKAITRIQRFMNRLPTHNLNIPTLTAKL